MKKLTAIIGILIVLLTIGVTVSQARMGGDYAWCQSYCISTLPTPIPVPEYVLCMERCMSW